MMTLILDPISSLNAFTSVSSNFSYANLAAARSRSSSASVCSDASVGRNSRRQRHLRHRCRLHRRPRCGWRAPALSIESAGAEPLRRPLRLHRVRCASAGTATETRRAAVRVAQPGKQGQRHGHSRTLAADSIPAAATWNPPPCRRTQEKGDRRRNLLIRGASISKGEWHGRMRLP